MAVHTLTTSGATVAVSTGDVVEISVPETGTTGYVWEVDECPAPLLAGASTFALSSNAPGAGGIRTMRFTAAEPLAGPSLLRLALRRPWESDTPPHTVFDVHLVAG